MPDVELQNVSAVAMLGDESIYSKHHVPATDWAYPPDMTVPEHEHMDDSCLEHCLTAEEAQFYDDYGYLHVKAALTETQVERLLAAADRVDAWARSELGMAPDEGRLNLPDFMGLEDEFLELIDCAHPARPPLRRRPCSRPSHPPLTPSAFAQARPRSPRSRCAAP